MKTINEFLVYIEQEKQLSKLTVKSYQKALKVFHQFIVEENMAMSEVDSFVIRKFIAYQHRNGLSARSITHDLSVVRSYFNYLNRQHLSEINPAKGIRGPKMGKRLPKIVEVDELCYFLNKIPCDEFLSSRDKAIMELFYSSGLRLSELQQLSIIDIELEDRTVRVTGKGNKQRIVPLGEQVIDALKQWYLFRNDALNIENEAVFITKKGKQLQHRSIQKRLEYWGKKLGLSSQLHPHKLRHSCATHFLESASDLRVVQELLGHAHLNTTQIYTHLDFQHLTKEYDAAHPRARKKK